MTALQSRNLLSHKKCHTALFVCLFSRGNLKSHLQGRCSRNLWGTEQKIH